MTEKYGIIEFLRAYPKCRWIVGALGVVFCLTPVVGLATAAFSFKVEGLTYSYGPAIIFGSFFLYITTVSGPQFDVVFPQRHAEQEREKAEKQFEESKTIEDALRLDFTRLNEYYIINQTQARSSFRWAIFAMLLGFGTIVSGIWVFYFHKATPDTFMASLTAAAGIVVNIISALFLHLHSKIQDRALHYYEQLSRLQRLSIAVRIAEAQEDLTAKQNARNLIIRELATLPPLATADQAAVAVPLPTST